MQLTYHTVDVFTRVRFGGNPLAVVLGADALSTAQMQAIAREFNYSETSFVLRPVDPRHTAQVRIFTPSVELPFAGHPNVGTAFVLASLDRAGAAEAFTFEEQAGLVSLRLLRAQGRIDQVQLTTPQPLSIGRTFDPQDVASCLSLSAEDIELSRHAPCVASVGLPFLVVEVATRDSLSRAAPDTAACARSLPADGPHAIYLYCRATEERDGAVDFTARMFSPFDGIAEDPATGSATAAAFALAARLAGGGPHRYEIAQGIDMGRPSRLGVEVDKDGAVRIGGSCVAVMTGTLSL